MKVVISRSCGCYGLSEAVIYKIAEKRGETLWLYERIGTDVYKKTNDSERNKYSHHVWSTKDLGEFVKTIDIYTVPSYTWNSFSYDRSNPDLVSAVEELGDRANGEYSTLRIVDIPDSVNWEIVEDDEGREYVQEIPRKWGEDLS